jgi:hypothetical protein
MESAGKIGIYRKYDYTIYIEKSAKMYFTSHFYARKLLAQVTYWKCVVPPGKSRDFHFIRSITQL